MAEPNLQHCEPEACVCANPIRQKLRFAFQPIIDLKTRSIFAHEALVRGPEGQGAGAVMASLTPQTIHAFDRHCRISAIKSARRSMIDTEGALLSLNTMPNAIYDPKTCLKTTLAAAEANDFPLDKIMFEMTEHEAVKDPSHFAMIVRSYQDMGFITAIDDFGSGGAGFTLFAAVVPDIIKLDMELVRNVHISPVKRTLLAGLIEMCDKLGVKVIAEGVEVKAEARALVELGVHLFQGYLFGRPELDAILRTDEVDWSLTG